MSVQELSFVLQQRQTSEGLFKISEGTGTGDPEYVEITVDEAEREANRQRLENCFVPLVKELKLQQSPHDPKRRGRIDKNVKNALVYYKFGDRLGRESFKGLDVSDMKIVRIAVIGPTGSGKSCFIGM